MYRCLYLILFTFVKDWLVILGSNKLVLQICFLLFLVCFLLAVFRIKRKKCLTKEKKSVFTDFFFFLSFTRLLNKYYLKLKTDNSRQYLGIIFVSGFINNCDVNVCTPNADTFFTALEKRIAFLLFFFDSKIFSRALFLSHH